MSALRIDRDDILQVTYLEAFLKIACSKGDAEVFGCWLDRIARNNLLGPVKVDSPNVSGQLLIWFGCSKMKRGTTRRVNRSTGQRLGRGGKGGIGPFHATERAWMQTLHLSSARARVLSRPLLGTTAGSQGSIGRTTGAKKAS